MFIDIDIFYTKIQCNESDACNACNFASVLCGFPQ